LLGKKGEKEHEGKVLKHEVEKTTDREEAKGLSAYRCMKL